MRKLLAIQCSLVWMNGSSVKLNDFGVLMGLMASLIDAAMRKLRGDRKFASLWLGMWSSDEFL